MLQVAQEGVGIKQPGNHLRRQQVLACQDRQGHAGRAVTQFRITATANQLENLRQEFDLADTTATEFDVVAALRMAAFLAQDFSAYLPMHVAQGMDRAEVEVTAVDEGPHDGVEDGDIFRTAGNCPRLDPGIAFPLAALQHQVLLNHVHAGNQRAGFSVGAKCHIDPETVAVLGHGTNVGYQPLA